MNSSLTTADSTTHVKIVTVALLAAMVVIWVGIAGRVSWEPTGARLEQSSSKPRASTP